MYRQSKFLFFGAKMFNVSTFFISKEFLQQEKPLYIVWACLRNAKYYIVDLEPGPGMGL